MLHVYDALNGQAVERLLDAGGRPAPGQSSDLTASQAAGRADEHDQHFPLEGGDDERLRMGDIP